MNLDNFFKILTIEEVVSYGRAQRNRQIDDSHVNDFYTIIKNTKFKKNDDGTYLVYGIIPIIVNPITKHILDGQHKREAVIKAYEKGDIDENARILVGLWEIDDIEEENKVIVMLNTKSKNWTLNDFVESYSKYNENYRRLREFCDTHMLCNSISKSGKKKYKYRYPAAMITGKGGQDLLRGGTFSFTEEQLNTASKIHDELVDIRKKLRLPMTRPDIEDMAKEWHQQRNFITVSQIKAIPYNNLPKSLREKKINNKKDWREVFSVLKDYVQRQSL